jgi:aminocarboxymuconate-semialdehyde decarboxylase
MVLANIGGQPLTDPVFAPIWAAIDLRALPVLVHPTAPPGVGEMDMQRFQLTASLGFTFDTSLAIARMIYDGFFDRYAKLKIIAAHGGGALPYLVSRMDQCYDNIPACREKLAVRPSEVVPRIYADAVVFAPGTRALPQGIRRRQRDVRLRLSAHDRRPAGMLAPRQCAARRRA